MPIDYKKELEEFTYIVSHDLNAPLRHVREFGKLLAKKMGDRMTDDEREYLGYMNRAAHQAETMIGVLLECSRLNTQVEKFAEFNTHELVQDVVSSLQSDIDTKQAAVKLIDLPEKAIGDQKQIKMLFSHLLNNALKFHREGIAPVITISAENKGDHWQLCIEDNGIGIAEEQYERVFTMFRRLNVSDENVGAGVGLTMAKKIVDRHDGNIWIESVLDKSTRVFFTLSLENKA